MKSKSCIQRTFITLDDTPPRTALRTMQHSWAKNPWKRESHSFGVDGPHSCANETLSPPILQVLEGIAEGEEWQEVEQEGNTHTEREVER